MKLGMVVAFHLEDGGHHRRRCRRHRHSLPVRRSPTGASVGSFLSQTRASRTYRNSARSTSPRRCQARRPILALAAERISSTRSYSSSAEAVLGDQLRGQQIGAGVGQRADIAVNSGRWMRPSIRARPSVAAGGLDRRRVRDGASSRGRSWSRYRRRPAISRDRAVGIARSRRFACCVAEGDADRCRSRCFSSSSSHT